jgi:hypothetical protein
MIAAQEGAYRAVTLRCDAREDVIPRVSRVREAVEKQDERAGALGEVGKPNAVGLDRLDVGAHGERMLAE